MKFIKTKEIEGMIWMLFACLSFSLESALSRHLAGNIPLSQMMLLRGLFSLLFLSPWWAIKKGVTKPKAKWSMHLLRGGLAVIACPLYIYAQTLLPMVDATAISFTSPLFTIICANFFLHESITKEKIIALLIGLAGCMIVLRPGLEAFKPASLLVIVVVIVWAVMDIVVKLISNTESAVNTHFYFYVYFTLFAAPFCYKSWVTLTFEEYIWIALSSFFYFFEMGAYYKAFQRATLTLVMPLDASRLVFASIIGYVAFNEIPDGWTVIGSLVIIAAIFYMLHTEARNNKKAKIHAASTHPAG